MGTLSAAHLKDPIVNLDDLSDAGRDGLDLRVQQDGRGFRTGGRERPA
jgi:hypothetical protein